MKEQKLVMVGTCSKGQSRFDTITPDQPIKPGTYNAQDFALSWPELYADLVRARMPALGDGQPVLITIT